jgi:cation diffusion facilitator CzcD-associated flavoprotein CzcO
MKTTTQRRELPTLAADRRRYFRIHDEVSLKHRILTPDEAQALREHIASPPSARDFLLSQFAASNREMEYLLRKLGDHNTEVVHYLRYLNNKIDDLARTFCLDGNNLTSQAKTAVDLSACGIAFMTDTALAQGSPLKLELLLHPSQIYIVTLGTVVRSDLNSGGNNRVAVEFETIRDLDRELLIQHVVNRQSELLRAQRKAAIAVE